MWRVYKEANRPWPVMDEDPVIDYKIMEAVFIKANAEEHELQKQAEAKAERERQKKEQLEMLKQYQ